MKAFSYLRVSGVGQIAGDGLPRQRDCVQTWAPSNGYEIVREFVDGGVTGKMEGDDRAGWVDCIASCQAEGVTHIIIEKLDRLARDLMVQEHILVDVKKRGLTLISVHEPDLCSDDPSRVLMRQVFGAIAQYDRAMIVLKLRAARIRKKRATGRCEGQKPFGARPGEDSILDIMRGLSEAEFTVKEIAQHLNGHQYRTRHRGRWHPTMVQRILARDRKQPMI